MENNKRIGILTSGGDCSGLNAVIESVVRTASINGYEVYGFKYGYDGLYANDYVFLNDVNVSNISCIGGSIIGNSNKTNLFAYRSVDQEGNVHCLDVSDIAIENLKKDGISALIVVGGDGSMTSARDFMRKGINVVCVPKTVDNDVPYTDRSFGYSTAVFHIEKALSALRTTGESHNRVMVLEVMGRHAGWLALEGGIAGNADIILLPEIKYNLNHIVDFLKDRFDKGHKSSIICVSEGAEEEGGSVIGTIDKRYPDSVKLGGIGAVITKRIEEKLLPMTGQEVRNTNLGYIQRGGETNAIDRVLGFEYGSFAVEAVVKGQFGNMVSIRGDKLLLMPITDIVGDGPTGETSHGGSNVVKKDNILMQTARSLGIYLGE